MKKRKKLGIALALLLSLGTVFGLAPAASAANPPWSGCSGNLVCFYQDGNGMGSKFYLSLPAGGGGEIYNLVILKFLNGQFANDQISSVSAPRCSFTFYSNYGFNVPDNGGFYYNWTATQQVPYLDFSGSLLNDQISSIRWTC